jgi:hypothetical protein
VKKLTFPLLNFSPLTAYLPARQTTHKMNLADHLRPLLRDHDCVIIPDFGGLVAEYTPARVQPGGRHVLSPPTRQVAFNQGLTRSDGLLVDALRQHLNLPAAEAREALRQAVATLHRDLQTQQRTELPGIGVFRQVAGRGLQFEYTGTDNLLTAAFGLPELTVHPVSVTDARLAREQQAQLGPRLRSAGRGVKLRRVVPGAAIGLLAGLAVAGLYLLNLHPAVLPTAWQGYVPRWEQTAPQAAPQQAALAQPSFANPAEPELASAPVPASSAPDSATTSQTIAMTEPVKEAPKATPVGKVQTVPAAKVQTVPAAKAKIVPVVKKVPARAPAAAPVEALLIRRAIPSPIPSGLPAHLKAYKVPASAAIALADESNVAKPIPMAQRKANSPALTTSYTVAINGVRLPASRPVVSGQNTKVAVPGRAAAKPVAVRPGAAAWPAAKPVAVRSAAAWPAVRPVAKPVAARPAAAWPAAKPAALVAKPSAVRPVVPAATKPMAARPVAPAVVAPAATASADVATTTIKSRTGRYYLVVAAYSSFARAEEGRRNLAHAGRPAKVILPPPGSRLYRLSAIDFADKPTATLAANRLRQNPHFDKGLTVLPY